MKWISAKDNPPKLKEILVVCKDCKYIHAVFWDDDAYILPEWCHEGGNRSIGKTIEFDWYMPLPELPKQDS